MLLFGPRKSHSPDHLADVLSATDQELRDLAKTKDLSSVKSLLVSNGHWHKLAVIELADIDFVGYEPGALIELFLEKLQAFDSKSRTYINCLPTYWLKEIEKILDQDLLAQKDIPLQEAAKFIANRKPIDHKAIEEFIAKTSAQMAAKEFDYLAAKTRFHDDKSIPGVHQMFQRARTKATNQIVDPRNRDTFLSTSGHRRFLKRYKTLSTYQKRTLIKALIEDKSLVDELSSMMQNDFSRWHWKGGF